ncbi:hypothetical protein [Gallibacterium anatis]|uniref:Lipoprotein n=1 Tax=Gallibacterium anatis TaxID=750 RepID=A0A921L0B4_9PAST|nr:hypothetical protein [Gallibacterium anatis]KGQ47300.1 hypothetical protein JL12_11600 [Gallibacterium anatis 10672-6]MBP4132939.1 hypothetical protein [Gallibacterium anatis]HJF72574.1 hypothetical protein [Gallibacterium anatis]
MKTSFIILFFLLSGCVLTGTRPDFTYWEAPKNIDKSQEIVIWKNCGDSSYHMLNKDQQKILDKGNEFWKEIYKNKDEYSKYEEAFNIYIKYRSQCLYDFGLRFKPPLHWCLAQDGDHNLKICIENMKYRN